MPFVKGHPGYKPVGVKNAKTAQWEALADSITGKQAEYFNTYIESLWSTGDPKDKKVAADLFLQTLEYFKPKQQRSEVDLNVDKEMLNFIIPPSGKS